MNNKTQPLSLKDSLTTSIPLAYIDGTTKFQAVIRTRQSCGFFVPKKTAQIRLYDGSREPNTIAHCANKLRRLGTVVEARHPTKVATKTKFQGGI